MSEDGPVLYVRQLRYLALLHHVYELQIAVSTCQSEVGHADKNSGLERLTGLRSPNIQALPTACCVRSAALPLVFSTRSVFKCVTMESCTFVKHLDRPVAWLHTTDCSQNALSHCLKVSWLKVREAGAEGKLRLATQVKVLFTLAGSGDQSQTVVEAESFLSVCIAYHFDDLGGFTNWSRSSPPVSVFLEG